MSVTLPPVPAGGRGSSREQPPDRVIRAEQEDRDFDERQAECEKKEAILDKKEAEEETQLQTLVAAEKEIDFKRLRLQDKRRQLRLRDPTIYFQPTPERPEGELTERPVAWCRAEQSKEEAERRIRSRRIKEREQLIARRELCLKSIISREFTVNQRTNMLQQESEDVTATLSLKTSVEGIEEALRREEVRIKETIRTLRHQEQLNSKLELSLREKTEELDIIVNTKLTSKRTVPSLRGPESTLEVLAAPFTLPSDKAASDYAEDTSPTAEWEKRIDYSRKFATLHEVADHYRNRELRVRERHSYLQQMERSFAKRMEILRDRERQLQKQQHVVFDREMTVNAQLDRARGMAMY